MHVLFDASGRYGVVGRTQCYPYTQEQSAGPAKPSLHVSKENWMKSCYPYTKEQTFSLNIFLTRTQLLILFLEVFLLSLFCVFSFVVCYLRISLTFLCYLSNRPYGYCAITLITNNWTTLSFLYLCPNFYLNYIVLLILINYSVFSPCDRIIFFCILHAYPHHLHINKYPGILF
jgi:hypothetical protein